MTKKVGGGNARGAATQRANRRIINKLTNSAGWFAREELEGALRGPKNKPDILITRPNFPPPLTSVAENSDYGAVANGVTNCGIPV